MDNTVANKTGKMNHEQPNQRGDADQSTAGPGSELSVARKASGRALTEFADELNISKDHLVAIEADQFDSLGGPTFVKGYIRAYARSLGMKSEPLIEAYLRAEKVETVIPTRTRTSFEQRSGLGILVGSALLAMIAVTVLTIWLVGDDEGSRDVESGVDAPAISVTDGKSAGQWIDEAPPLQNNELSNQADKAVRDALFSATSNATAETKQALDPKTAKLQIEKSESIPATPATAPPVTQSTQSTDPLPPVVTSHLTINPSATKLPVVIGEGADNIHLLLSEDSWVEVQDSSGAVLLQGLYSAGASRDIKGTAPFQVFLGNAPGVAIKFNGNFFDSVSFIRENNTARFALVNP